MVRHWFCLSLEVWRGPLPVFHDLPPRQRRGRRIPPAWEQDPWLHHVRLAVENLALCVGEDVRELLRRTMTSAGWVAVAHRPAGSRAPPRVPAMMVASYGRVCATPLNFRHAG